MDLAHLPILANVALFALAAAGIWVSGTQLVACADELAERWNITKALIGLLFLATVTELPEIVTTATAAAVENPALLLGNMFGGITLQTSILAVVDGLVLGGMLTARRRGMVHVLEAVWLLLLLALLMTICGIGDAVLVGHLGVGAVILAAAYACAVYVLQHAGGRQGRGRPVPPAESLPRPARLALRDLTTRVLLFRISVAVFGIVLCGIALVHLADTVAVQSGLGSSFIGISVLAAATSLPELATTLAAARLGALSMAISNIFGSNLIMVALILPADLIYLPGPILDSAGTAELVSLAAGFAVTAVYWVGLMVRHKPRVFGLGLDSLTVVVIYLGSLVALYQLR